MIAEIVEAFEERTHRRAEAAFYSGNWLIQKCATGLGIFITGQIIAFSQLPANASPGSVDEGVLFRLALAFGAGTLVLALAAAFWLARFPISRAEHEARLERLASRPGRGAQSPLDEAARADPEGHSIGA